MSHSSSLEKDSAVIGFLVLTHCLPIGHLTLKYPAPGIRDLHTLPRNLLPLFAPSTTSAIAATTITVIPLDWTLPTQRKIVCADVVLVVDCIYHPVRACGPATTHDDDCARSSAAHGGARGCQLHAEDVQRNVLQGWVVLGPNVWNDGKGLVGPR